MGDIAFEVSGGAYKAESGVIQVAFSAQSIDSTSTLNGDTTTLLFEEDTNSDGTIDNTEEFTLSGGSESFTPSNLDLSAGNKLWVTVQSEDGDSDITTALSNIDITVNY